MNDNPAIIESHHSLPEVAGLYQTSISVVLVPANTWQILAKANPLRIHIRVEAFSPAAISCAVYPAPAQSLSSTPTQNNMPIECKFVDRPCATTGEWYGRFTANTTVVVTEEVKLPR